MFTIPSSSSDCLYYQKYYANVYFQVAGRALAPKEVALGTHDLIR